ncbi:MAG: S1C family serine protease [Planctomycetota bacterium]|nr:S1C family serine protease [Planctomycetota bacterium]
MKFHKSGTCSLLLACLVAWTGMTGADALADERLNGFLKRAVDRAQPRTVKIFGASVGRVEGYGTGIMVSDDGMILTGNGVFLNGFNTRVTLHNGRTYPARVVRRDTSLQLALLKIEAATPDYFELKKEPLAQKGDWVIAISNAFKVAERAEPLSVTLGVLSLETRLTSRRREREVIYDGELYLIDCITSNPGAAGGAVVTADGQLVGMIGKLIESRETNTRINYAVPARLLAAFVAGKTSPSTGEPSTQPKKGKPADLGIVLFSLGGRKSPAFVDRVKRGSAAQKAGIRSDDLVVTLSGRTISHAADYQAALAALSAGEKTVIVVKRRTQLKRFEIIADEK